MLAILVAVGTILDLGLKRSQRYRTEQNVAKAKSAAKEQRASSVTNSRLNYEMKTVNLNNDDDYMDTDILIRHGQIAIEGYLNFG